MKVAIIDGNILAAIGLKQILSTVMPMMHIDTFGTMAELHANAPDTYFHFFANTTIVLQDMAFFSRHRHKTIVLTTSTSDATQLTGFHSLCTSQSEAAAKPAAVSLRQPHASKLTRDRGPLPHSLRQDQQGDSQHPLHQPFHGCVSPQTHHGQAQHPQPLGPHHLRRDARLCGCEYDLRISL